MEKLIAALFLLAGSAGLYFGAKWLVRGSVSLALKMGIHPVIIGLTVVAFGTSSPELLVSFNAGRTGNADIAIGNVIGSNIANVALILGASALIRPILLNIKAVRFDIIFMLAASLGISFLVLNRDLGRFDGSLLLAGIAGYIAFKIFQALHTIKEGRVKELDTELTERLEPGDAPSEHRWSIVLIIAGILFLASGSELFIRGAVTIATVLGVSNVVIGLTVVAFGTSLPELVTSMVASAQGEGDVSLGNVVGSNIFNILFILGATALFFPISTADVRVVDLLVMLGTSLIIIPFSLTGSRINRFEALFLLLIYAGYIFYLYAQPAGIW